MPGEYTFNSGSKLLEPVADGLGLTVDKINFAFCLFLSLPVSIVYYWYFAPGCVSRTARLAAPLAVGIGLCHFCFGSAIKHLLANALISYLLILYAPPNHVHRMVFLFAMGYLSYIHWYRCYVLDTNSTVDITGPLMMLVQKVTSIAFSIHDGRVKLKKHEQLTEIQAKEAVKKTPDLLEFLSYCFHFQSVLCGPLCFYTDYISFIDGTHYETNSNENVAINGLGEKAKKSALPSPWSAVKSKVVTSICCIIVHICMTPYFDPELMLIESRQSMSFIRWYMYLIITTSLCRVRYYFAWSLADAINNASGFGFNGYSKETGKPKWDLITNIWIYDFEVADSWKAELDVWNVSTMRWLRRLAYERAPIKVRTASTFLLSAWWHGFFPGYYMTFATGALATSASRRVRRCCRHYFVGSPFRKNLYDTVSFLATKIITAYVTFPFVFVWFWPSWNTYRQMYFSLHILCALAVAILPKILPPPRPSTTTPVHQKTS